MSCRPFLLIAGILGLPALCPAVMNLHYVDVRIDPINPGDPLVVESMVGVAAPLPLTVQWYLGAPEDGYDPMEAPSGASELLAEVIVTEFGEGDSAFPTMSVTLPDEGTPAIWVRAFTDSEAAFEIAYVRPVEYIQPAEIVVFGWQRLQDSYFKGSPMDVFNSPVLEVRSDTTLTTTFYEGPTGDTTKPVVNLVTEGKYRSGWEGGLHTLVLENYVIMETVQIWARLVNRDFSVDVPAETFVAINPDPLSLNSYTAYVTDVSVGELIMLRAEASGGTVKYQWYWGEKGDRSDPIVYPPGFEFNNFIGPLQVPAEPTSFWLEISNGFETIQSETGFIIPLPLSPPAILDQPNDVYFKPGGINPELQWSIAGGNLTTQWFEGEPGDQSRPIDSIDSIDSKRNRRTTLLPWQQPTKTVWVKASNSFGEVQSNPIRLMEAPASAFQVVDYPLRVYGSDTEDGARSLNQWREVYQTFFWADLAFRDGAARLLFQNGDQWETVSLSSLQEGRYKVAFTRDALATETGPIHYIPTEAPDRPAHASLVVPADSGSMGGLKTALIAVNQPYDPASQQVYAGRLGQRGHPVDFWIGEDFQARPGTGLRAPEVFRISWEADAAGEWWYEVATGEGAVLMTPLTLMSTRSIDAIDAGLESPGGRVIKLPSGISHIPLPAGVANFQSIRWRTGESADNTVPVQLPVNLEDFSASSLKLWGADQDGALLPGSLLLEIDPGVPPLLSSGQKALAVLPGGRAVFAGAIEGDVNCTVIREQAVPGGDWQESMILPGAVNSGFHISEDATAVQIEYQSHLAQSVRELPVVRIPQALLDFWEAERVYGDALYSRTRGTLHSLSTYPWILHPEMGWMFVSPYENALVFYANTAAGKFRWNLTTPAAYPYFLVTQSGEWLYMMPNTFGWFFRISDGAWIGLF